MRWLVASRVGERGGGGKAACGGWWLVGGGRAGQHVVVGSASLSYIFCHSDPENRDSCFDPEYPWIMNAVPYSELQPTTPPPTQTCYCLHATAASHTQTFPNVYSHNHRALYHTTHTHTHTHTHTRHLTPPPPPSTATATPCMQAFPNARSHYHCTLFHTSHPLDTRPAPLLPDGGVDLALPPAERRGSSPQELQQELEAIKLIVHSMTAPTLEVS